MSDESLATPEERERAVAHWETQVKPEIEDRPNQDALRAAAAKRLEELRDEPTPPMGLEIIRALVRGGHGDFEIPPQHAKALLTGQDGD